MCSRTSRRVILISNINSRRLVWSYFVPIYVVLRLFVLEATRLMKKLLHDWIIWHVCVKHKQKYYTHFNYRHTRIFLILSHGYIFVNASRKPFFKPSLVNEPYQKDETITSIIKCTVCKNIRKTRHDEGLCERDCKVHFTIKCIHRVNAL